jgi:hypothetical protein
MDALTYVNTVQRLLLEAVESKSGRGIELTRPITALTVVAPEDAVRCYQAYILHLYRVLRELNLPTMVEKPSSPHDVMAHIVTTNIIAARLVEGVNPRARMLAQITVVAWYHAAGERALGPCICVSLS